ncbi:serine/threonine-protein kinase Nek1-like [Watersipora subatra]|uniref:serine/threonine-protein kinase Nek1-like n=1 Tax=Watersipora subatra TaxID=2589382 RepID=UPI00355B42ED
MNKYQKVKMIGEGSFGKAFLVKDRSNGKQYVIKEIAMGKMGPKEREDARKEVAVLAQLQHPNIVSYKESFEEFGNLFISMDFCDAGDLFARINAQRGVLMQEAQILDMFVQISLAIKHIHDRKILHRDIKSQNIFITRGGIMKVGDFGISKVMNSTMELARTCIGTPYYLSPEICENRPYNNKSDIWSLGCVLYEMTTLKHPFEAGSMKNLVLKIIRGTYPPVPPRYSYELRNLLAQLFKRNPRDRPSINTVLNKPFIQARIKKFLNESEVQAEFSHTILHGAKLQKRLPPGGRPVSAPAAKKPTPAPTPAFQKYDPASVYKNKVAARRPASAASRPAPVGRQISGGAARRPPSAAAQRNNDIVAKRKELLEKEKRRRAELVEKRAEDAKLQHQKFVEKQKQDRIKRGKDQWRSNLLDSYGDKDDNKDKPSPVEPPSKPDWVDPVVPAPSDAPRGNYARYHEALDKQRREREARLRQPISGGGDAVSADPISAANRAAALAQENRQRGADSAERARVVEDFRERQRQAMVNKARGQGVGPASRPPSGRRDAANNSPFARNPEENDYLQKLKQIRQQNFFDRRALQERRAGRPDPKEAERLRNEKIEALRAQAEERGKQLKAQLERQRQEAAAREQKAMQQRAVPAARPISADEKRKENIPSRAVPMQPDSGARAVPVQPASGARAVPVQPASGARAVPVRATPMPGLTKALNAIGSEDKAPATDAQAANKPPSMTNVMSDIGAGQQLSPQEARQKWAAPAATPLVSPGKNQERGKWAEPGQRENIDLSNITLEATGSQMEATAAPVAKRAGWGKPTVLKPAPDSSPDNRPAWGSPSGTVVNVLQAAPVIDSTTVIISAQQARDAVKEANAKIAAEDISDPITEDDSPSNQKIGVTISVSKPLVLKKPTILTPGGATITMSKDAPETANTASTKLADTSVPLFNKMPKPSTPENKMAADADLDVMDLDLDDREKKLIRSLERAKQPFMEKTSGLMIGLTVGNFDCNTKMLRTCSEPDLAKLFRTMDNPFLEVAASAVFAESSESESDEAGSEGKMSMEDEDEGSEGDEEDENADSEDEDTTLYQAELAALMASQNSASTEDSESRHDPESVTPSAMEEGDSPDEASEEVSADRASSGDLIKDSDNDDADDLAEQDVADFEQMRATLQQLVQDDKPKGSKKMLKETLNAQTLSEAISSIGAGVAKMAVSENKEEWMSDSSSDTDHSSHHEEEEDQFCRLEESRVNLEKELGEATFLQAYKIIQAAQEDEEESLDEGRKLVTKVLGKEKSHLYDKILHLVVSDSAYSEGN